MAVTGHPPQPTSHNPALHIISRNRLGPDCSLDDVGVELDAAVGKKAFEDGTTRDRVAERLGQLRFA